MCCHLYISGLIEVENVATQKNFHGNSDSAARGLQCFVRSKPIADWKISNHPQVRLEFLNTILENEDGASSSQIWQQYSVSKLI